MMVMNHNIYSSYPTVLIILILTMSQITFYFLNNYFIFLQLSLQDFRYINILVSPLELLKVQVNKSTN